MTIEYKRSDLYVHRRIGDENLLISLQRTNVSPMCELTPTAADVWASLSTWMTKDALAAMLSAKFDVDRSQAAADVEIFLHQLESMTALTTREVVGHE